MGRAMAKQLTSTVRCPTYSSAKVERITGGKKLVRGAAFGMFAADSMECKVCKYKW